MPDYSLLDRHRRITKIGELMAESKPLTDEDRKFLSEALISIGAGADPQESLDIKVKSGGRPYKKLAAMANRDRVVLGLVAALMAPCDDDWENGRGLGLTLDEVINKLSEEKVFEIFGITEDTIRKYWNNRPDDRNLRINLNPVSAD